MPEASLTRHIPFFSFMLLLLVPTLGAGQEVPAWVREPRVYLWYSLYYECAGNINQYGICIHGPSYEVANAAGCGFAGLAPDNRDPPDVSCSLGPGFCGTSVSATCVTPRGPEPINVGLYHGYFCDTAGTPGGFAVDPDTGVRWYSCTSPPDTLDPNKNNGCSPNGIGNPCNAATGNKYQVEQDFVGEGPFPLSFSRYYNSKSTGRSTLGFKWSSNYSRRISTSSGGARPFVVAERPDGRILYFNLVGSAWKGDPDVADRVVPIIDASGNPAGWRYTSAADDEEETYDATGRLIAISHRTGLTQTLSYDSAGRLAAVADPFGRRMILAYDASGRLASITDAAAQVYTYGYNSSDDLTSVTYPDGAFKTYLYGEVENTGGHPIAHVLTGVIDERGNRFSTYKYGHGTTTVTSTEHAGGANKYSFVYGATSTIVADPLGVARSYGYRTVQGVAKLSGIEGPPCDTCGSADARYDANGNMQASIDFNGNLTCHAYDLSRNLEVRRTEGRSGNACPGSATPASRTISTDWHPHFRLPLRVAEPKRITRYDYDANGNLIAKIIQATADGDGSAGLDATPAGAPRTWKYTHTYHPTVPGFVSKTVVDGPRMDVADVTTYVYDSATGVLASVINALGHVTTLGDFDAHGRPRQITDPNGLVITLTYDPRGRITSRSAGGETSTYAYDPAGQLIRVTNPDSSYLAYAYDAAHRLIGIQDNVGNKITYVLDAMGNRIQEQVLDPSNSLTQTRSRVYDSLNRLVQDIGANSAVEITRYRYDSQGNLAFVTDPLNRTTSHIFDALNRLVAMVDPAGGQIRMNYDGLDQVTSVTDPRSLTTRYGIDGLGNVAQQASPDTGLASSAYDAAGNLVSSLDATGVQSTYTYDALDRLISATYTAPPGSGFVSTAVSYSYDQGPNGMGRLTGFTDATGSTAYRYDQRGRVIQETRTIAGVSYSTSYQYDAAGRLVGMTYPDGRQLTYVLDALGRVGQIDTVLNGEAKSVVFGVAYRPFGPPAYLAFGNGQMYTRSFDLNGRVTGYSLGEGQSVLLHYDPAGRITQLTDSSVPSVPTQFSYDALDRLTAYSQGTTTWSYAYDANGNRTSLTIGGTTYPYSVSATSNQLNATAGPTATSYSYNAVGNVARTNATTFTYDARHRLIGATTSSGAFAYGINALGQRVQKVASAGSAAIFHYDVDGRLIAESDAGGKVHTGYVWLGDMPVGVIKSGTSSSACSVTAPTSDPGSTFAPFNSLTRLEVRSGRPRGADWQWALGTNTQRLGRFAAANLNWVSGREYDFTLRYNGQGAGSYSVSYAGRTLFTRKWPRGLQVGNAIQLHARTSAGIGSGNFVKVQVLSINGSSVGASLRTAGDDQLSEAKLTYLLPEGQNGFTLAGKITFTFTGKTPPPGSRMSFTVRAGNVTCAKQAEKLYFVSSDHLNTPRAVSDEQGNVVWSWEGEPFGSTPAVVNGGFALNLRFPGQYFDDESGLHHNYFRDYEAHSGRYLQADPLGLVDDSNLYSYVSANPSQSIDPLGLNKIDPRSRLLDFGGGGGGGVGGSGAIPRGSPGLTANGPRGPPPNATTLEPSAKLVCPPKGTRNPAVKRAAERGQQKHKEREYPEGFKKEVPLPSGKKMDAYNPGTREIVELKPNNPRAVRRGERQAEGYCAECNVEFGPGHTWRVETYD
jgi:RHS repeat-associated protein